MACDLGRVLVVKLVSVHVPFHHGSRGYAVPAAGTMPGSHDLAASSRDAVGFEPEAGTTPENPPP